MSLLNLESVAKCTRRAPHRLVGVLGGGAAMPHATANKMRVPQRGLNFSVLDWITAGLQHDRYGERAPSIHGTSATWRRRWRMSAIGGEWKCCELAVMSQFDPLRTPTTLASGRRVEIAFIPADWSLLIRYPPCARSRLGGGSDAIRSMETPHFHHAAGRRGCGVAIKRARTTDEADPAHRYHQLYANVGAVSGGAAWAWLCRGPEHRLRISFCGEQG